MDKNKFLLNEFATMTLMDGLATRNKNYPIYKKNIDRNLLKEHLRNKLLNISKDYRGCEIGEEELISLINGLAEDATKKYQSILYENHFRIGISQKIVNLFLKYLWCSDWIKEPPHCPFDSIIKNKLNSPILIDWTKLDNIDDYKKYVKAAHSIANIQGKSIAQWELATWNPNV